MTGKKDNTVITTILGPGCVVNGDFTVNQSARIDGEILGDVSVAGLLIMGSGARIDGNIDADEAIIGGDVVGNIQAKSKVELTVTAKVIGDITTNVIVIDENAIFQGRCDMNQDAPRRKNPAVKKAIKEGRRSAKAALQEALREVQAERDMQEDNGQTAVFEDGSQETNSEV
ncbi:MAG: polymer-forming cytoskeletal protein [bacterium]|nr:polymer-forming cytoskeletal protein [bacterium]MCM1375025.1 polymer-forming cytoskeletal protein [Muribaculum sp.]